MARTAISPQDMERFARALLAAQERGAIPEVEFQRLHRTFIALDDTGAPWSVGLQSRRWSRLEGRSWSTGTPPEALTLDDEMFRSLRAIEVKLGPSLPPPAPAPAPAPAAPASSPYAPSATPEPAAAASSEPAPSTTAPPERVPYTPPALRRPTMAEQAEAFARITASVAAARSTAPAAAAPATAPPPTPAPTPAPAPEATPALDAPTYAHVEQPTHVEPRAPIDQRTVVDQRKPIERMSLERAAFSNPLPFASDASSRGDEGPLALSLGLTLVFAVGALLAHRPAGWFVAGVFAFLTLMLLVRKRAPATLRRHRTSQVEELS